MKKFYYYDFHRRHLHYHWGIDNTPYGMILIYSPKNKLIKHRIGGAMIENLLGGK